LTGAVEYKITDELASYASPTLATIDGRRWCFAFARQGLVGFEPASGQVDFEFPWRSRILESVNASNPIVVGDQVLISETYGPGSALLRVKPGGYEVVWSDEDKGRNKSLQTHWNTAVYVDGHVYGSSGRHKENAELRCVNLATGEVKWSQEDLSRSSLLYVDGHFVCLTETGKLLLLKASPSAYEPVAEVTLRDTKKSRRALFSLGPPELLKEPAWAAPVLSHGLLFVRGANRLVCLELIPEAP
jgi:outer membrane protein assembly factor BamB